MDFRLVAGLQLPWYCKALGLPLRVGVGARCGGTFVVFGPSGFSWACFNDVGLRQASRRNVCFKCVQVCECVCVFVLVFSLCVCLKVKSHSVPSRSWGPKSISWPSCSISGNGKSRAKNPTSVQWSQFDCLVKLNWAFAQLSQQALHQTLQSSPCRQWTWDKATQTSLAVAARGHS